MVTVEDHRGLVVQTVFLELGARPEHLQGTDLELDMSEFGDASNRVTFSKFHGGETVTTER